MANLPIRSRLSSEQAALNNELQANSLNPALILSDGELTDIQEIWVSILQLDKFSDDDLFELGGTSLHAMMIASKIEEQMGYGVVLDRFLQAPTFSALLQCLTYNADVISA